jgi:ABC-type transporter Mla subunit MlaD
MTARGLAAGGAVVAGLVAAVLLIVVHGGAGTTVRAEFTSARGLVVGDDVRIFGAPAGSVDSMTLTPRGTALVKLSLHSGLPALHADAIAAIRPENLLGESYVSLSPGSRADPLPARGLDLAHTSNEPQLAQLLDVFRAPQRSGLQALLVEAGLALDRRGVDVSRTVIALRDTLTAADAAASELDTQNARLSAFVGDAGRVAAELAARNRALGGLVEGLGATAQAAASQTGALDRGLSDLPATLARVRPLAAQLASLSATAKPLVADLAAAAPGLSRATGRAGRFLTAVRAAAATAHPVLGSLRSTLQRGAPALTRLAPALGAIESATPATTAFASDVAAAAPGISQGFFVDFADQAAEPGKQPFDPFADPRRNYWRGAGVLSCEAFGVKVAPGCLTKVLSATGATSPAVARAVRQTTAPKLLAPVSSLLRYLLKP